MTDLPEKASPTHAEVAKPTSAELAGAQPPATRNTTVEEQPQGSVLGFAKGFGLTFGVMFKHVYTQQYPFDYYPPDVRYHGRHVLNRHPDGLEKCVGCELCAWACPADAIYVEGGDNTEEERYSPGERYGAVYQINYLRCIFCGLCIEACPTRSLTMSNEYELALDNRQELIYTKEQLMAPLLAGHGGAAAPDASGRRPGLLQRGDSGPAAAGRTAEHGQRGRASPSPVVPSRWAGSMASAELLVDRAGALMHGQRAAGRGDRVLDPRTHRRWPVPSAWCCCATRCTRRCRWWPR